MPLPCCNSPSPVSRPGRLRSYRNESKVGDDQRSQSRSRGTNRSRFSPQSFRPGVKLRVRDGMTISADQPSGVLAVRASQIPSQSSEALSDLEKVAGTSIAIGVQHNADGIVASHVTTASHGVDGDAAGIRVFAGEAKID